MGKRIQKLMLKDLAKKTLYLGYASENIHTQIVIDCSEVFWDYPNATYSMNIQPPRGDKYHAAQLAKDGDTLVWTTTDSDLIYHGSGHIQLEFKNGDEVIKSAVGTTKIDGSIETTGDVPTPLEDWMDRAEETAEQIAETAASTVLENYDELTQDVSSLKSAIAYKADAIYPTISGSIATFEDGADGMPMRKVEVAIEPVQDLHGYDAPWPAGGGKNLLSYTMREAPITSNGITFTLNSDGSVTINGTATATATYYYVTGVNLLAGNYIAKMIGSNDASNTYAARIYTDSGSIGYTQNRDLVFTLSEDTTVSCSIYVYTGFVANNVVLRPMIEAGSIASEWTPYSNICPISGWTGAKVTRTGKNLFDIEKCRSDTIEVVDGVMTGTATNFIRNFSNENGLFMFEQDAGRIVLSFDAKTDANAGETGQGLAFFILYTDGSRTRMNVPNSTTTYTRFTIASESDKIVSKITASYGSLGGNIWYLKDIQLERGSTATDYEPYQGQIYEVTFPSEAGTVYGGTLDVVKGMLTVDRAITDLGTQSWQRTAFSGGYYFVATISDNRKANGDVMCSAYKFVGYGAAALTQDCTISRSATNKNVFVRDDSYSTAEDFKTAVSGVQLCYYLEEPISIQLDPVAILSLLGENHLFADAGNISVTYPADTKMYIDRKITEAVANALNA